MDKVCILEGQDETYGDNYLGWKGGGDFLG